MQFDEAPPTEWRFRVYVSGHSIPLADLLPLLDQLGLRALDERAFRSTCDGAVVRLHDVGVRLPDGVEWTMPRSNDCVDAFEAKFRGDGRGRRLQPAGAAAGLTVREVEVVRAYARYLRQINFPFSQQYIEATVVRHAAITRSLVALFARASIRRWPAQGPAGEASAARRSSRRSTRCRASTTTARCACCWRWSTRRCAPTCSARAPSRAAIAR